ncbi:MAG: YicC family protein [Archangium gephyra]|uniref:YicC family protein n=1 Tax=Archangium gephyra TaxID=48 RepID=A0A2W5V853_9BACT|nr:MAG: YicC family protein [Archangium gephyra]
MLRSMTGFGSGTATAGSESLTVEIRSVNHKFCEVKVRVPRELSALEPTLVKLVKDRVARGAIDVTVRRAARTSTGVVPQVDLPLAKEYLRAWRELGKELGLGESVSIRDIATSLNVIRLEEPQLPLEDANKAVEAALVIAIEQLHRMREKEGVALKADLSNRLGLVATWVKEVQALAPKAIEAYRARLSERIAELSQGLAVDPQRLAQEVAFFAERTDVAEEMTRLDSHLVQFEELLRSKEPSGRKMDFLVQEMHREVNTTGSKSQHADISARVMQLKAELERVREQVQNVE